MADDAAVGVGDEPSFLITEDGRLVIDTRTPYCDCAAQGKKVGYGFTKRRDGVWVRPCCMRPERARWERWGDKPIPPDQNKFTVQNSESEEGDSG